MKKLFIGICAITALLLLQVSRNEGHTVIIYSSMEQFRGEELQRQLDEKFPSISTRVMYMPTAKAAAKISMEKEGTDADIIVGLESSYMDNMKDSLADIEGYSNLTYMDGLSSDNFDNRYVTWERFAGAFIINNTVLQKHGVAKPETYDDLLKPEYQGLIAMSDPKSSGTGYFFYKNMVNTKGEAEALSYLDKLEKNVKQFTESGSGPVKLLIQGEIGIGLGLTFQAVSEMNKGMDFEVIYPDTGSPFSLTGTGMIKGRDESDEVKEIFSFIVNDFLVYDKENFSPERILKEQVNKIENYPQDIQYADMEGIDDIHEKERLLNLWKY